MATKPEEIKPPQRIPIYNPAIHRAGDTVRVLQGDKLVTMVIPKLDGDGKEICENT